MFYAATLLFTQLAGGVTLSPLFAGMFDSLPDRHDINEYIRQTKESLFNFSTYDGFAYIGIVVGGFVLLILLVFLLFAILKR